MLALFLTQFRAWRNVAAVLACLDDCRILFFWGVGLGLFRARIVNDQTDLGIQSNQIRGAQVWCGFLASENHRLGSASEQAGDHGS
jgi:hypothetical protein